MLGYFRTEGSSTEDFRSVIDDLTVVNKKLKQKLKKYERTYDAHLQEEKLFEVRFHGLPDHKKKELEEMLRKFASELDDGATSDYPQISSRVPVLEAQNTTSSTSRFAESGYASMSASGQNSSTHSNQEKERRKLSKSAYNRQQQSIHSYLHDIPAGLRANSNVPMTDKSKKKLVVRRLEQIFAGKQSAPGNHPQPMQQEEVAQSAATADREQREANGRLHKPEGLREARINPNEGGEEDDVAGQAKILPGFRPTLYVTEHDFTGSVSPDQRPTRPLDLDLYRAQVPMENMDYFRHLGFTPPDMVSGDAPALGHGWLYLNLLINMAQLHTLNVTPEFVKDALHEYSSHLEISHDGRKIRWNGGHDVTIHSSGSSSEYYSGASPDALDAHGSSKNPQHGASIASSEVPLNQEQQARRLARAKREEEQNKFAYKPMFFRKEESDDEDDNDVESSSNSLLQPQQAGNSSGFGSSAMQSATSKPKPRREDGPMIFYTKAKFCTDLSGDRLGATLISPGAYKTITSHPLGVASGSRSHPNGLSDIAEPRGPLDVSPMDVDSVAGTATTSSGDAFGFSPDSLIHDSGKNTPDSMELEASGLGGVQPEDNFSVHVRRSQTTTASSGVSDQRRPSLYPRKIHDILYKPQTSASKAISPRTSPRRVIKEEVLSSTRTSLPSSTLPPASFFPFDSVSSGDVSDIDDDDGSSEPDSESDDGPATAFQILNISPHSEDDSEEASQYSEDTDDGSVDLLATARQLDPTTIRASEREYDAAVAERLAEIIPAGSSAATAGGGSGFNTPAHPRNAAAISREDSRPRAKASPASGSMSSQTRSKLKRTRTSESATALKGNTKKVKN